MKATSFPANAVGICLGLKDVSLSKFVFCSATDTVSLFVPQEFGTQLPAKEASAIN